MKVFFQKIDPSAKLPSYAYDGDAGMDLFSCEDHTILSGGKEVISTGFKISIPKGHGGFIWDKSGIAINHHIKVLAGVIDSNYTGELKVGLTNLGKETYVIRKGEKIAQLIIKPVEVCEIIEVEKLEEDSRRGEKRFGSSGLK